ncbi:MAG TPA: TolC family protein [Trichormus sp.]
MHPKLHLKLSALYLVTMVAACAADLPQSAEAAADQADSSTAASKADPDDFALREDDFQQSRVQPVRTLSLSECFAKADQQNKQIIATRYNIPIAEAGVKIAAAIPNPRFSLLYGWGKAFTLIIAGNPQQFGWMQEIQTAGKRTKAINLARANLGVTGFQIAATMFDVHNRVRRAYAEQAAAEAYVELIDSERKVALDLMRTSQRRFTAGKVAKSEVLQAQLGVLQFDTQRNQAQARLQQATAALALLIGETPENVEVIDVEDNGIFKLSAEHTDIVPQTQRPLPQLEQLLPVALSQRPDLKAAIQQAYADRKGLTLARSRRIPDIFVDAGYQFTTFNKHQPYELFQPPNPATTVPNQPGAYLNITAEAPLFYHHQGETDQAKATWLQDFDENQQLRFQIATDIVSAYEAAAVTRANIFKFQQDLIPQAATVARLARRSYEVGKTDLASAILAKQQYQQTLSSYFDAVVAYQTAWADLEKAVGVSLKL